MPLIRRTANSTHIGPLTIYRWGRSALLSIESYSHSTGTTLAIGIHRRSFHIETRLFPSPDYRTIIRARRYYRKGN